MLTDTTSHQLDWKGPFAAHVHSRESWNPRFHILSVHIPSRFSVFHHNFMQMKHCQEFSLPPNISIHIPFLIYVIVTDWERVSHICIGFDFTHCCILKNSSLRKIDIIPILWSTHQ